MGSGAALLLLRFRPSLCTTRQGKTSFGADFMGILSRSGWTATSDSILSGSFPESNAIDGDPNSFWHSASGYPHWIKVDLGSAQSFDTFQFWPRPSSFIRVPTSWTLAGSNDNS